MRCRVFVALLATSPFVQAADFQAQQAESDAAYAFVHTLNDQARSNATPARQKTAAEIDEQLRKSAHMSVADWEKRKSENNAFTNGTFAARAPVPATMPSAQAAATISPQLASQITAGRRYPQLTDANSEMTKAYLAIGARLAAEGSAIVKAPNAAERIADMAAGELRISPNE